jgi:translation initiation factor 2B subunit (eIF-2B alpha/beta/delta family)
VVKLTVSRRAQDEERNFRSIETSHLETLRSRNATKLSYLLALRTLKHFRETSDDKLKEYEALQSSIKATHIHLLEFEKYIQQLQERLTALSQAFGECEAKTVTRLEFSSTISDGIRILQEAENMSRRATRGFGASSLLSLE